MVEARSAVVSRAADVRRSALIDALPAWLANNPGFDVGTTDLLDSAVAEQLDWSGISRGEMLPLARAFQRLHAVHADQGGALRLLRLGFATAQDIANIPRRQFALRYAEPLGVDAKLAETIHRRATRVKTKVMQLWATVRSTVASPYARALRTNNAGAALANAFEPLPSYQDLFGSLDYLSCSECESIFGPAAYLVDLLRIIDERITQANPGIPPELRLAARRPDLGEIPLTCEETYTTIPYLTIINERLGALAAPLLGVAEPDLYRALSTTPYPFNLPFHLPLAQLRAYLAKLGLSLAGVYAAWNVTGLPLSREALKLSPEQFALVTTSAAGNADELARRWGVAPGELTALSGVELFDRQAGLDISGLRELVYQDLSAAELAAGVAKAFYINGALQAQGQYLTIVEVDGEPSTITNLGSDELDRIARFVHLARLLGWSSAQLDWALRTAVHGAPAISDDATLWSRLAAFAPLATKLGLDLLTTLAMCGPLKTYGTAGAAGSQFDQVFNDPARLSGQPVYHPKGNPLNPLYTDDVITWTIGAALPADQKLTARLTGALQINLDALNRIGARLFPGGAVALDVDNLSALYRHARLFRALGVTLDQYFVLLDVTGLGGTLAPSPAELGALTDAIAWIKQSRLSIFEVAYFLADQLTPYVNPRYRAETVGAWLTSLWALVANAAPGTADDQLLGQLAILFGDPGELIAAVMPLAAAVVPLPSGVTRWQDAFLTVPADPAHNPLRPYIDAVLRWASRWLVVADRLGLGADLLGDLLRHPAQYGLAPAIAPLTLANLHDLYAFQALVRAFDDQTSQLLAYVAAVAAGAPAAEQARLLASATGWDPAQIEVLVGTVWTGVGNVVTRLDALDDAFALTATLGADVTFVGLIAGLAGDPAWDSYVGAAAAVHDKVAGHYETAAWSSIATALDSDLGSAKRDALLPFVLWQLGQRYADVRDPRNVYELLLIDVETGPAVQISRIREALNACQLYLQRCRLRLEIGVDHLDIPPIWWSWIMNYRLWEANRQVYLYPENYLLPSVRQTKTSLFQALENELQQSNLTDGYVEDAYKTYIDGFRTIAKLKPVDLYHATVKDPLRGDTDTLFLFGRTETSPATFYVATLENSITWTQWTKIDINIASNFITPVYAFNKLFIFWAELKQSTNSSISSKDGDASSQNSNIWKLTINYSFQNHLAQWVSPQALVSEEVVLYDGAATASQPDPFASLFDMDNVAWHKVYVFKTDSKNLRQASGVPVDFEKISILYGPILRTIDGKIPVTPPAHSQDPELAAFQRQIYDRTVDLNRIVDGKNTGFLPLNGIVNLNTNLQDDALLLQNEFLVLASGAIVSANPTFNVQVDTLDQLVQLVPSPNVIYDNYLNAQSDDYEGSPEAEPVSSASFESSNISPTLAGQIFTQLKQVGVITADNEVIPSFNSSVDLAADLAGLGLSAAQLAEVRAALFRAMGGVVLFRSIASGARVLTVKNQPGWFIFDNGDESFLLTLPDRSIAAVARAPVFAKIDQGMAVRRPPVAAKSFEIAGIDAPTADKILVDLQGYKLVDAAGFPQLKKIDLDNLELVLANEKLTKTQLVAVQSVLLNGPIAFDDSFVAAGIDVPTSKVIYQAFQDYAIIDQNSRVNLPVVSGSNVDLVLANLIQQGKIKKGQIPAIYETLVGLGAMIELAYENTAAPAPRAAAGLAAAPIGDLHDYVFDVARTSTGAADFLSRALFVGGIRGLLNLSTQQIPVTPVLPWQRFDPDPYNLQFPRAIDGAQVDFDGLYGPYYWEIFFQVPMLLANSLGANHQFEQAQAWFEYVFLPTAKEQFVAAQTFADASRGQIQPGESTTIFGELQATSIGQPPAPILDGQGRVNPQFDAKTDLGFLLGGNATPLQTAIVRNLLLNFEMAAPQDRYWQFQPFRNYTQETLRWILSDDNPAIRIYEDHPFDPHAIARVRIGAYEKATVMQYIENLIAWGDAQFTQDTFESITAATMLYVYANDLLGPRPVDLGPAPDRPAKTFNDIQREYGSDPIPTFLIDLEHKLAPSRLPPPLDVEAVSAFNDLHVYFCVPENAKLVGYWDTIEDRLFKIRNSMNIKGQVRQLALFEPPLNPLDLVKASAAGSGFLPGGGGAAGAVPAYRFTAVLPLAKAVTGQVMDLGGKLLAALEKRDAEALSLLRSSQEAQILNLVTTIKQRAIDDAQATIDSLQLAMQSAQYRRDHYATLIKDGYSAAEQTNLDAMAVGLAFNIVATALRSGAAIAYTIPQVGSPFAMTYGGIQIGSALAASGAVAEIGGEISSFIAQRSLTIAGYQRREEDWTLARDTADLDQQSIQKQIDGATARLAAARQDLLVQQRTIEQNQRIDEYLRDKFTSAELYVWMTSRISAVYFQTYQLALELARQAQKAYQFELRSEDQFVTFDYWDELKKGLMAGENLAFSLAQMEAAYLKNNTRLLEIERTVSLASWDPSALWELKTTGKCSFKLTEALFDYDFPGHFNRQIKTISLSVPAVIGPYQNLKATLTQTYNAVVTAADPKVVSELLAGKDQPTAGLRVDWAPRQQIAISRGVNDPGVFALDFRDERYLPFEGTGAVSRWELVMPRATNRFDFQAISDVIIELKYTAEDGGIGFRGDVEGLLAEYPYPGALYLDLAQAYSSAWMAFMNDHTQPDSQTFAFRVSPPALAYFKEVTLTDVWVKLDAAAGIKIPDGSKFLKLAIVQQPPVTLSMIGGVGEDAGLSLDGPDFEGTWTIQVDLAALRANPELAKLLDADRRFLDPAKFADLEIILAYQGQVF